MEGGKECRTLRRQGVKIGGFLQQQEMASTAPEVRVLRVHFTRYWILATVLHPDMGVMWGLPALLSWQAVNGAAAREVCCRNWRGVQR
jgi:hypothetical protein